MTASGSAGRRRGVVDEYDDVAGYGTIIEDSGRRWFVHCTAVADGSRTLAVGATVSFSPGAGHLGQWEARDVGPG